MFVHIQQEKACETVCRIFINKRVISMNSIVSFVFRVTTWQGGREDGGGISSMRKDAKSSSLSNSPLHAAIVELSTGSDRGIQGGYSHFVASAYVPTKGLLSNGS